MKPRQQKRGIDGDPYEEELKQLEHLLRRAIPPLAPDQLEPRADLWPQLRARIESQSTTDREANSNIGRHTRVPWFDWALAALAAAALLIFPGIIPALLYHF